MKAARNIKTCFVTAPQGIPLEALRESLLAHGIAPIVPQELSPGADWATELQRAMAQADLVVGVLPVGRQSPWVLFELGQAWALGHPILLIAPPGSEPLPATLQRLLVLQTAPDNRQAIDFALDQLTSAPAGPPATANRKVFVSHALGDRIDVLLSQLDESVRAGSWREFEQAVADAIRGSGADVVAESPDRDRGADLAVWSDVLEPFVGNPLLIEMKLRVNNRVTSDTAFRQLQSFMSASNSRWALLVYGDGPPPDDSLWVACPPNVLLISGHALLEALRTRSFPEVVRDLRNSRVHRVRP